MPPLVSETAITVAPAAAANCANREPTFPKPWIATLSPAIARPRRVRVSSSAKKTPRPVASSRPSEPPTASGLPVTTLSTECPWFIEKVSKIQAITAGLVPTSGAAMSFSGPISLTISEV